MCIIIEQKYTKLEKPNLTLTKHMLLWHKPLEFILKVTGIVHWFSKRVPYYSGFLIFTPKKSLL